MATVEIFTTPFCGYCARAKALLAGKGVAFSEIDLYEHPARREEAVTRSGGRTSVPQIFIDGTYIGGSDDLAALDGSGELDRMLAI